VVVATTYGRRLEVQEGVSPKERKGKGKMKEGKRKSNTHTLCRMKVLRPMPTEER
jgi:hypothetical protein